MSAAADAQSAFFQRMTGLGFAIMSLGYAKCGVSKDAWIKQTMLFHVISTPIFFLQCASDDGTSFTPWVWCGTRRPFLMTGRGDGVGGRTARRRRRAADSRATHTGRRRDAAATAHRDDRRYLQIAINIALAGWGYTEMAKNKTK